ncbi:MAG: flagellar hook-associated protein FlgK [Nitrospina sp.]|jgi:flagellar hook-associated protein 1|nr:flagellar hook-associated protein FlgK [Nitrospina sp.]MBT3875605.1 flagellar hook-associated protein FlgK [Nitrospina sp.]MBT4047582.1 flagellar hook-associated protein FlgK [Nitrospina sp.]MBT4556214.1 flagellar hook-associated protein FlgK [Nitrospina sp.]MBT5348591.1 flagellar hook-associated protein FlgK [Nitrospina sp.]
MTSNIFSILNTAKLGLLSQQLAIEVTGQNISNVQTEGYSRQEINFEATNPRSFSLGQLGTGVRVAGIERSHDEFLFSQILGEGDALGRFEVRKDVFDQLEILLSENGGQSLNQSLSKFFSGVQDVSANPTGLPERSNLVSEAKNLASVFNNLGESLFQIQQNLDATIEVEVTRINSLTEEIASLNKAIHANEPTAFSANDLRDKRDLKVKELSELIDLNFVDEQDGQISLTLSDGTPLVLQSTVFTLDTSINGNNKSFKDIVIQDPAGNSTNITSSISGGSLKGYLEMRDTEVEVLRDKLDRLGAGFVQEFNNIHQQGFGIDGSTGNDFFSALTPTVVTNTSNTGSATLAATNGDPANISVDKFEITFTGSNSFSLSNLTTGVNEGTFNFTTGTTFNLANGFAVTISGTAAVGDKIKLSVSESAARNFSVASGVSSNSNKIAAGLNSSADGANALELVELQSKLVFNSISVDSAGSGSFTFDEFYGSIVSTIGIESFSSQSTYSQQEGILLQLNTRRESISGVSIDEEMINMIKFQQAYNAAARLIGVVDELLDTVISQV